MAFFVEVAQKVVVAIELHPFNTQGVLFSLKEEGVSLLANSLFFHTYVVFLRIESSCLEFDDLLDFSLSLLF